MEGKYILKSTVFDILIRGFKQKTDKNIIKIQKYWVL
jgi:hypothetical protein